MTVLTPRWRPLRPHKKQIEYYQSLLRFNVNASGRRSGKTEIAKRRMFEKAWTATIPDWFGVFAAPTRDQAKKIYWADAKAFSPKLLVKEVRESELSITYINGAMVQCVGMDKPERIEGRPLDHIVLDEYANMREGAWAENIRPALSTVDRPGSADIIGVPEGRNHYYKMAMRAQSEEARAKGWAYFHWTSEEIIDPDEIAAAKAEMDPLIYAQEYLGSFITFEGRIYYNYDAKLHDDPELCYNPELPLVFCFDFNVAPGVAAVVQEQDGKTCVIGEVWIPKGSNTVSVCRRLISDWGHHKGEIYCYGDASGGAKTTSSVDGSDWDIIKRELREEGAFPKAKVFFRIKNKNPLERTRVNAVNARLKTADGQTHFKVNPVRASHVCADLDLVTSIPGTAGEIDKHADPDRTHISDGLGYYIEYKFPMVSRMVTEEEIL